MSLRALIVEDEPLARRKLERLLGATDDVRLVGVAVDGEQAVASIDRLRPDVVFLDIQLPGASGLDVLERIEHRPHVVFTTAFDRYAVTAFELRAIDYLLKPFGRERLAAALERAREALGRNAGPDVFERASLALANDVSLTRLFVRVRGRIVPIATADIECFEAHGDYVRLHTDGRDHLIHVRLKELEARLDPERFVRVHRSHIVNLDHLLAMEPCRSSRFRLSLRSGLQIVASRARSRELRRLVV